MSTTASAQATPGAPTQAAAAATVGVESTDRSLADAARPAGAPATGITGAQSLVRSLEAVGVDLVFGLPGGAILPLYDPLFDSSCGTCWSATSRAPGTRPPATPRPPAGSGSAWRPRPRRDEPGHPAGRRLHGLGADRRHHRPGGQRLHRDRRLPGGRHPRHHDADHQAQLPGHRPRRDPAADRRGLPPGLPPAGPARSGRRPQGRAAGDHRLQLAAADRPARLQADHPPARQAGPRGRRGHPGRAASRCSTSAAVCSRPAPARPCASSPS